MISKPTERPETNIRKRSETIKIVRPGAFRRPVAKPTMPATKTLDGVAPQVTSPIPVPADTDSTLSFHPFAKIFPVVDDDRLQALANDIAEHGLLDPIVLHERKILDGRNRYLACKRAGVTPRFRQYDGKDPLGFVISRNVHRRHLTKNQRVLAAARAATLPVGSNQTTPGLPIGRAAKVFEVSERNIARAKTILRHGIGELVEAVESGKIAISRAAELCELAEEVQATKLRKIIERRRTPRNNTKKPAVTGSASSAARQTGGGRPSPPTPSTECDFVAPKTVAERVPRDTEASYSDLLDAWFKASKSVRLKFIEEVIHEY